MVTIIVIAITLGALGILFSNISLMCDEDTVVCGIINTIGVILLCAGIIACFNKTQTVYCPECGDKKDPIVVDIDERYCSSCGSEYIVLS